MRIGLVAVVGLMAVAAGTQAQQPGVMLGQASRYVEVTAGCPGQLMARQQASGFGTVWTLAQDEGAIHGTLHGLGIHVEFAATKTAVKALELRVSYLPPGPRSMLVDPKLTNTVEKSPEERTKTFNLDREAAMRIGGDLLVGPAATITRVRLISATFADGNVWRAANEDQCSIEPSKYMLVEAKK